MNSRNYKHQKEIIHANGDNVDINTINSITLEDFKTNYRKHLPKINKPSKLSPRENPEFKNGKIYSISSEFFDDLYIGSTTASLPRRLSEHKCRSKTRPNRKVYRHFLEIGWENAIITLIENFPCNCQVELKAREMLFVDKYKPSLNTMIN